jgi:glucose-1-phosphate cytidylyltransferase
MKVVLFCGGQGLRIRDAAQRVPKPMVPIGNRPILLHLMKYYAHFGHTEFIWCLGYRADVIKEYFLSYKEAMLNDFVFSHGGQSIQVLHNDIQDWRITFVNTGLHSNVGQRLLAVQPYLGGDKVFLANYADGLTDLPLGEMVHECVERGTIANFLCVKPTHTLHMVQLSESGIVRDIQPVSQTDTWVNGGYFVLRREIFDYIQPGDELVEQPFQRLIAAGQLHGYRYAGFWMPMDTFKDQQTLETLYQTGQPPWEVWHAVPEQNGLVAQSAS